MKKIISLFKRDYEGDGRLVYDEIVPGAEWVVAGEGVPTLKVDGTCCMVLDGELYKRYDRKMMRGPYERKKRDPAFVPQEQDYKPEPDGWIAAEDRPNHHTGHWPGWLPVDFDNPENKWHAEAWHPHPALEDGTYELIGPKVQSNPYDLHMHMLIKHGLLFLNETPRDFEGLREWFETNVVEGIVWHHPDGRMVKIKRSDFGYLWPEKRDV